MRMHGHIQDNTPEAPEGDGDGDTPACEPPPVPLPAPPPATTTLLEDDGEAAGVSVAESEIEEENEVEGDRDDPRDVVAEADTYSKRKTRRIRRNDPKTKRWRASHAPGTW